MNPLSRNGPVAKRRDGQLGFAEALLSTKGGSGSLDRLDGLVRWYRFAKLIGRPADALIRGDERVGRSCARAADLYSARLPCRPGLNPAPAEPGNGSQQP